MRRTLAAPAALAFLLAFFAAPFLHVHTVKADDHHQDRVSPWHGAIVHAHFPHDHSAMHDGADIAHVEQDEHPLNVFAFILNSSLLPDFLLVTAVPVETDPPAVCADGVVLSHPPCAHDPPALAAVNPRAPPA
jgi:hypothetical protein